ncbi:hypothetical protein SETIT_1G026400v2 [Setaria italica]|uniref:Uncharacterized protein n=1 Tax=Setaria italica TaxID=4555 RepID=A0A368PGR0_SETIT|nr:hypothetical protein SETIT_1G026400v2 [Setaria italica]
MDREGFTSHGQENELWDELLGELLSWMRRGRVELPTGTKEAPNLILPYLPLSRPPPCPLPRPPPLPCSLSFVRRLPLPSLSLALPPPAPPPPSHGQENQLRNKLLRKLIRAIDIISPSSDNRQTVGSPVCHNKHLCSSFCG